jgi:hypothetical protein
MSPRRTSYAALFVALGLTGAYAETIPNFEVLSLVAFSAGLLLGAGDGAWVGGLTMLIYTLLNPYGTAPPLVMGSQVLGLTVTGATGGWLGAAGLGRLPVAPRAVALGLAGIGLTFFFDLITNAATGLLFGSVRLALIGGLPFALWHIATNTALFAVVGTPVAGVLESYRSRLSS